jgi:ATP-dependent Clp protease, protease subunit
MIHLLNQSLPRKRSNTTKIQPVVKIENDSNEEYWFGKRILEHGVMFLTGDIDNESVLPIIASIMEYNLLEPENQPSHLTLFVNSPGGYTSPAYHLIDSMKQSPIPVQTIGMGEVASAALMILMAGVKGKRMASETCSLMSHQYSAGLGGKEHEILAGAKDMQMESARMMLHYKKCTKKSESYIRKHLLPQSDCYLTPEEAVKHGIIDGIVATY